MTRPQAKMWCWIYCVGAVTTTAAWVDTGVLGLVFIAAVFLSVAAVLALSCWTARRPRE
mgnify:CR=1 FL=1